MQLTITQYDDPEVFRQAAFPLLLRHEAANNLLLGIALALEDYIAKGVTPLLLTLHDSLGVVRWVAARTPPYNMVLCGDATLVASVARTLHTHCQSHGYDLPGMGGPKPMIGTFVQNWEQLSGRSARLFMDQRILRLDRVVPPRSAPGRLRPVRTDDHDRVKPWLLDFVAEALGAAADSPSARSALARLGQPGLYGWELADGVLVSLVASARPTVTGVSVNYVYTPPHLRGKGYASNAVAALSRQLLDAGYAFCCLFTDATNPTSNKIYTDIGYREVSTFAFYEFA